MIRVPPAPVPRLAPDPAAPDRSTSRTTVMLAILAAVVLLFSRQRRAR